MDATIAHSQERARRIEIIKKNINQIFEKGLDINKEGFLGEIVNNFTCSRRTALDYLQSALFGIKVNEIKFNKEILIIKDESRNERTA